MPALRELPPWCGTIPGLDERVAIADHGAQR